MIVYKITNLVNNKIYIGQTVQLLGVRWSQHRNPSARKTYIHKAITKHGKNNFIIEQIDRADSLEELNNKEAYWIKLLDSTNPKLGYNLESGGLNKRVSQRTKDKISEANKGKKRAPVSEETKKKISEANTGKIRSIQFKERQSQIGRERIHTEEAKRKIGEKRRNRVHPPMNQEARDKISKTHKGKKISEETKQKMRISALNRKKIDNIT